MPNPNGNPESLGTGDSTGSAMQAKRLQDTAYELGLKLRHDVAVSSTPSERVELASAVRAVTQAFDTAAERRRILLGRGLPKNVDAPIRGPRKQPSNVVAWESQAEPTPDANSAPKQQGIS